MSMESRGIMNIEAQLAELAWYLVQCKPRSDQKALEHLERQGFECFLPRVIHHPTAARAATKLNQPLFPGYIFLHMRADGNWAKLRSTRGVNKVVGFCGKPCQIDDAIIRKLKDRHFEVIQKTALEPGDRVHIGAGPLADMEAIFMAMDGEHRVTLLLRLLNRERPIKVPLSHLRSVPA